MIKGFHRFLGVVLPFVFAAILWTGAAMAADLYVGTEVGDFPTIQQALNAAGEGDTVYVRSGGIYFEDIVINTRGVRLVAINGEVALHGDVAINADRVRFEGFALPEGKTITVADGINFVNASASNNLAVFVGASRHSDYNLVLGNVTVDIDQNGSGVQAYQFQSGTITHSGTIDVTIRSPGSIGSGFSITDARDVSATLDQVSVTAGSRATGVSLTAVGDVDLTISGNVSSQATATGSSALGADLRGQHGLTIDAEIGDVTVSAGGYARGIVFYDVGGGDAHGQLTQSGTVRAKASQDGSQAFGVLFNNTENLTAMLGRIEVEAGDHAKGIGIDTALPGRTNSVGDNARISVTDTVDVVARDANSQGYGIDLLGGDRFSLTAADIQVRAGGLARGIYYRGGADGSLSVLGSITATAVGGNAYGALINAGDRFQATIKDVAVVGGGNFVQGVALNLGGGGVLEHAGTIEVTGTSANSTVRGLNLVAGEAFSATVGDVAVQGLRNALGVYWQSTDDASLTQIGTIEARTSDTNGNTGGATILAGDRLSIHAGDVVAQASGANSSATGLYVQAGDDFRGVMASLTTEGARVATGLLLFSQDYATVDVDVIDAVAHEVGSSAFGATVTAQDGLNVRIGDLFAHAGADARGLHLTAGRGATVVHTGAIEVEATDSGASSRAEGVRVNDEGDLSMTLGDVAVSGDRSALGVLVATKGDAVLSVTGDVEAIGRSDDSVVHGVQLSGIDALELEMELQNVVLDAGHEAYAVNVGGTSSVVTIFGDVTAKTRGGVQARGLTVNSKVAEVTNHGHLLAGGADYVTAAAFGEYVGAERVHFHNLGTVEATGNLLTSAVVVNVTESAIVQNDGAILTADQSAFVGNNSTGAIHLTNTGLIVGAVQLGRGADELILAATSETHGDVNLRDGDDVASIAYGAVLAGWLDGGAGDDALRLLGAAASTLPPGPSWSQVSARNIETVLVDGGAWQLGSGSLLGDVAVKDAFLRIDGPVTVSRLHLEDGGLVGEGQLRGDVTNSGGIVVPGNGYGILTIRGDYVQGPDGILSVQLDATSLPEAGVNYNQLVVTDGKAVFVDGTTVKVTAVFGPTRPSRAEYEIVRGDVEFDPDAVNVDLDIAGSLFYGGWLERGSMVLVIGDKPYESVGVTENQKSVARALGEAKDSPGSDLADLFDWLADLGPDDESVARNVFDSLTGEVYTHLPTLNERRIHAVTGAISSQVASGAGRRLWAAGYRDSGRVGAGDETSGSTFKLSGLVAGADILMTPTMRIGLSAGGGPSSLTMEERDSTLKGTSLDIGAYGHFASDGIEVVTIVASGRGSYTGERAVQFGSEIRTAEAEVTATGVTAAVEARFRPWTLGGVDVEPVVALNWFHGQRAAFQEKGAGEAGLLVKEQALSQLSGRIGLQAALSEWTWGNSMVLPYARLAWITDLQSIDRAIEAALLGTPEASFTVTGSRISQSGFEVGFGIRSAGESSLGWGLEYAGAFRAGQTDHALRAQLSFAY